jgi:hypothetical protein
MRQDSDFPIWRLVGFVLLVYGLMIVGVNVPHPAKDRLASLIRAIGLMWGSVMAACGAGFVLRFWRSAHTARTSEASIGSKGTTRAAE